MKTHLASYNLNDKNYAAFTTDFNTITWKSFCNPQKHWAHDFCGTNKT